MTETAARIRWEPTGHGGWTGHVGTMGPWVFQVWKPDPGLGKEWRLDSALPGQFAWHLTGEPEALKKGAEAWLEEFVTSLGAIFPGTLREAVTAERDWQSQRAADYEETSGHAWQADMALGAVNALDWTLATIGKMAGSKAGSSGEPEAKEQDQ